MQRLRARLQPRRPRLVPLQVTGTIEAVAQDPVEAQVGHHHELTGGVDVDPVGVGALLPLMDTAAHVLHTLGGRSEAASAPAG